MTWKISALLLAALSAAVPAYAQHSSSEPVLDVSAMDKTIDPCVDFYTYSCGSWIKKNPIPADRTLSLVASGEAVALTSYVPGSIRDVRRR